MPTTDIDTRELFDMQASLKRLGGSRELLVELFQFFLEDAPTLVENLQRAVNEGRYDDAFRSAHSLKGLASNFDAHAVTRLAKQIEENLRQRDIDEVQSLLPTLRRNVEACMAHGRKLLQVGE